MEEFLSIDWAPPLEDILDGKFVDIERLQMESATYRALRGNLVDPFTDLHRDFEDSVTDELITQVSKKSNNKKKKTGQNENSNQPQDKESPPQERSYVPGITTCSLKFPKTSTLNCEQMALCLRVLLKFSGSAKLSGTAAEKEELETYMNLKAVISQEQEAFLEFAKSNWDSSQFQIQEEEFINSQWSRRVKVVESLPRYYIEAGNIPLVSPMQVELHFQSNCLEIGIVPRIIIPVLARRTLLPLNTSKLYQRFFSAEGDKDREENIVFKVPVSKDPNCEKLAKLHDVDLVISSAGLNCLAINMDPNTVTSWILPVVVRHINEKNVVFVDKPLPPSGLNVLQKNAWLHKYNVKSHFVHPFHSNAVKLDESYEKTEDQDVLSQDEENVCEDSEEDPVPKKKKSERREQKMNYNPPATGHNLFYRLFNIGCINEPQNELMKNRIDRVYKLLVRTKVDGVRKENKNGNYLTIIAPKVEHQLVLGAEAVSIEEAAKQWMALTFRPDTSLVRARIDATSLELIQYEKQTAISVKNEITRLYNIKAEAALTLLYNVADSMTKLSPGNYLLRHTPRNGTFACIYKESEGSGKNALDLQTIYWSDSFPTIPNPPWPLLDKVVVTPAQKAFNRMPAMFKPPPETKSGKKKRGSGRGGMGSRGRGRGRGRGKKTENQQSNE